MSYKIMRQQIDDYTRSMGQYDALADLFNENLARAQSGTPYAYQQNGQYYITKGSGDGGLSMMTAQELIDAGYVPEGGIVNRPQTNSDGSLKNYSIKDGNLVVSNPIMKTVSDMYGGESSVLSQVAGKSFPIFPTAPNIADYKSMPEFTKGQERILAGEKTLTQQDQANKTLLDKIKGETGVSPYADSNLGILGRVMAGKL